MELAIQPCFPPRGSQTDCGHSGGSGIAVFMLARSPHSAVPKDGGNHGR